MDAFQKELIFTGTALACAGLGSVYDIRERRIPNRITGPSILAGLALHAALGGWHGLGASALAGLTAGGVFLVFFLAGGMGAGDVKLMAAVGCLSGLSSLPVLLIAIAIAGAIFAIVIAISRGLFRETLRNVIELLRHHSRHGIVPHGDLNLTNARTLRLPFALPIAAGCLVAFYALASGPRP